MTKQRPGVVAQAFNPGLGTQRHVDPSKCFLEVPGQQGLYIMRPCLKGRGMCERQNGLAFM